MPTLDADIQESFNRGEEDGATELTLDQIWRLILYECEEGDTTVEELLEIRKTGIWPEGKCNLWAADAEMLLGMLSEDYINARHP